MRVAFGGLCHLGDAIGAVCRSGQCPHARRLQASYARGRRPISHVNMDHCHGRRRRFRRCMDSSLRDSRHRLPDRRGPVGCGRFHRHARFGPRQCPHGAGSASVGLRRASTSPSSPARSPACWSQASPCSAISVYYLRSLTGRRWLHRRPREDRIVDALVALGVRRLADLDLRASRRRYLHQGRRRRRRPRRQGARPAFRRTIRATRPPSPTTSATMSATAPVWRPTCSRPMRSRSSPPWCWPRSSLPGTPISALVMTLSAGHLRCLDHHLDHRHLLRQAWPERLDHGRSLQGPHRHRGCCSIVGLWPLTASADHRLGRRSALWTARTFTGTRPVPAAALLGLVVTGAHHL